MYILSWILVVIASAFFSHDIRKRCVEIRHISDCWIFDFKKVSILTIFDLSYVQVTMKISQRPYGDQDKVRFGFGSVREPGR